MSTTIQLHDEVLPGYILAERIGSGGYSEVWRARAPGGIDKAVKIVNGYYDEEFASQEMKALERIKDVRHPFLLSLERFEVVNGRLAILTELADMSLEQRAQECRAEGQAGIPRQELLRYMADAAEALDYLVQRYGLQHLDIKPANLLILGEHVKVADFGLVKELTTRTQNSLVAGMTPTYASPEMFDDDPSTHSDQYSLAIVYQELLVGVRAFPGRTAAQLAKQHTQAQPQLIALPSHDRPIVARALAKNPADRYPSCRAFVEALLRATAALGPGTASKEALHVESTAPPAGSPQALADTESGSVGATRPNAPPSPGIVTQPVRRPPSTPRVSTREPNYTPVDSNTVEETLDVPAPSVDASLCAPQPTLFIGIGGVGIRILGRLRQKLKHCRSTDGVVDAIEMIALDTDRSELKDACSPRRANPMASADTLHLPLRLPQDYGDDSRDLLAWLSRRWLYNIPRSLETQGYRPLGRIALVDHADRAIALLDRKLKRLCAGSDGDQSASTPRDVKVVLVASMGGGTGAGMAIDVANAARSRIRALGAAAEVTGVLVGTCLGSANSSVLAAANTYALLAELHHASAFGNRGALSQRTGEHPFESDETPFEHVYCVPTQRRSKGADPDEIIDSVATYLSLETIGSGGVLRSCRQSATPKESAAAPLRLLRSFGCASLNSRRCDDSDSDDPAPSDAAATKLNDDMRRILDRASADLLHCGCDRRTLLFVPPADSRSEVAAEVTAARPTAAVVQAEVDEPHIVCEASGILPRSVAAGLERVYPGIAEAAGRLFTRIDIEWQPLN